MTDLAYQKPKANPKNFIKSCRKCKRVIAKRHKWRWATDGRDSWVQHRCCANPGGYYPKESTP